MQRYWVLIRGLVRGVGHWSDFPKHLEDAFPGDQFEYLEIPGNGSRHQESSPLSIVEMVEALRDRSEFIQEGKKIHIIAISMGAMVATAWAEQYPQEIEKLFLINSSSAKHAKFYERLRPENYLNILKLAAGGKTRYTIEEKEREILRMTANSSERRDFALPLWTKESTAHPIHVKNLVRQLWAAGSYKFPDQAPAPTTILTSENDRFVSANCSKNLAKAWNCPLHIHPWAGHDLPLDDFNWVLERLRDVPSAASS